MRGVPDVTLDQFVDDLVALADGVSLVLGSGGWVVSRQLADRSVTLDAVVGDWPSVQLPVRFRLVVVEPQVHHGPHAGDDPAAALHCATQHLVPGGHLVTAVGPFDDLADRFSLEVVAESSPDGVRIALLRRPDRRTIHDVVHDARSRLDRITPDDLARRLMGPNPPTVVDTRTSTDRARFGVIPGSIHVPRTVVEWHLDPANGYRHPTVDSFDQPLVLVCNGGYSSSLAAASLLDLGFTDVTDLIGGVRAWVDAGLDVVDPDHSHLDV